MSRGRCKRTTLILSRNSFDDLFRCVPSNPGTFCRVRREVARTRRGDGGMAAATTSTTRGACPDISFTLSSSRIVHPFALASPTPRNHARTGAELAEASAAIRSRRDADHRAARGGGSCGPLFRPRGPGPDRACGAAELRSRPARALSPGLVCPSHCRRLQRARIASNLPIPMLAGKKNISRSFQSFRC